MNNRIYCCVFLFAILCLQNFSMLYADEKPLVIILNGTSSAGKSSIAHEIQKQSDRIFIHTGIDHFIAMLPPSYLPDGKQDHLGFKVTVEPGPTRKVSLGPVAKNFIYSIHRSMKVLLDHKFNIIIDEVLVSDEDLRDYLMLFKEAQVILVGVKTSLEVAEKREISRGDRLAGYARGFYDLVHRGKTYDLEICTSTQTPGQCAKVILDYLDHH